MRAQIEINQATNTTVSAPAAMLPVTAPILSVMSVMATVAVGARVSRVRLRAAEVTVPPELLSDWQDHAAPFDFGICPLVQPLVAQSDNRIDEPRLSFE